MLDLPSILFSVVDTGLWSAGHVRAWADRLIEQLSSPAVWLLNLSMASTDADVADVIQRAMRDRGFMLSDDVGDLMVGLLYWRLRQGHLEAERFSSEVGDVLDAYGSSAVDVDTWNAATAPDAAAFAPLEHLLEELLQHATAAVKRLEDVEHIKTDPFFLEI